MGLYVFDIYSIVFLAQFSLNESKRQKQEKLKLELKHEAQIQELESQAEYNLNELRSMQNEKRKLLVEHESEKLKTLEENFNLEMKTWKDQLKPRKKVTLVRMSKEL